MACSTLQPPAHSPVNHDGILLRSRQRAPKPSATTTKCESSLSESVFVCYRVCGTCQGSFLHGSYVWVCGNRMRGTAVQTSAWLTSNSRLKYLAQHSATRGAHQQRGQQLLSSCRCDPVYRCTATTVTGLFENVLRIEGNVPKR